MIFGRVLLLSVAQRSHALVLIPRDRLPDSPDAGGDEGIRTPDLLRARQALSQLSYAPLEM